jgi:hypothetical protein
MRKVNKTDRTQNKLDQLFQDKLRDNQATPPDFMWDNIEGELNAEREKSKFDHWYYIILALLIPFTIANVLIKYNISGIAGNTYQQLTDRFAWLTVNEEGNNSSYYLNNYKAVVWQPVTVNQQPENPLSTHSNSQVTISNPPKKSKRFPSHPALSELSSSNYNNKTLSSAQIASLSFAGDAMPFDAISNITADGIEHIAIDRKKESLNEQGLILPNNSANTDHIIKRKLNNVKGFFIGADVRISNSRFLIKKNVLAGFIDEDVQYNLNFGIAYSLSLGYNFSSKFGIETEASIVRQGQQYVDNTSRKLPIEGDINLTYFQIPVLAKIKWTRVSGVTQNPVSFNMVMGPVYSRLVKADYLINKEDFPDKNKVIPLNELGLAFGLEYDIYMTNNSYLTLGVRTSVSTDVKSFPFIGPNNLKTLNMLIGLNASYNLQLRPKVKAPSHDIF